MVVAAVAVVEAVVAAVNQATEVAGSEAVVKDEVGEVDEVNVVNVAN